MSAIPSKKMTVDEFLTWSATQPGRYELYGGVVYRMQFERARHAAMKFAAQKELERAIKRAKVKCHMLPDGMTVRIDDDTTHEPDALVYCGKPVDGDAVEIANPVIVVEVLSPGTRHVDGSAKLAGYFRVPSIQHYLILDPNKPTAILHSRQSDQTILTRIATSGTFRLDPPGIELEVDRLLN